VSGPDSHYSKFNSGSANLRLSDSIRSNECFGQAVKLTQGTAWHGSLIPEFKLKEGPVQKLSLSESLTAVRLHSQQQTLRIWCAHEPKWETCAHNAQQPMIASTNKRGSLAPHHRLHHSLLNSARLW